MKQAEAGVFFFSSRRRPARYWRDWSSDVCSSDLLSRTRRSVRQSGGWKVGCANLPPSQNLARAFLPPSQNLARAFLPPSQNLARAFLPPSQNLARAFLPPSQNLARAFLPPSQNVECAFLPRSQFPPASRQLECQCATASVTRRFLRAIASDVQPSPPQARFGSASLSRADEAKARSPSPAGKRRGWFGWSTSDLQTRWSETAAFTGLSGLQKTCSGTLPCGIGNDGGGVFWRPDNQGNEFLDREAGQSPPGQTNSALVQLALWWGRRCLDTVRSNQVRHY